MSHHLVSLFGEFVWRKFADREIYESLFYIIKHYLNCLIVGQVCRKIMNQEFARRKSD